MHDNFFELGGHSLLATQIASRVQEQLQLNVPLRAMFECSTVEELAEYVRGLQGSALDDEKVDRLSDLMAELEDCDLNRGRLTGTWPIEKQASFSAPKTIILLVFSLRAARYICKYRQMESCAMATNNPVKDSVIGRVQQVSGRLYRFLR